jgi:chromosome segregation ATPase
MRDGGDGLSIAQEEWLIKKVKELEAEINSRIENHYKDLVQADVQWKEREASLIDEIKDLEADLSLNASMLAHQCDLSREAETRVMELEYDNKRLEKWVGDLQSGMYINCVYCGHQYPKGTPGVMQEILYEHIRKCPKHPLRKSEARVKELETDLNKQREINFMAVVTASQYKAEKERLEEGIRKHEHELHRPQSRWVWRKDCREDEELYKLIPRK